MKKKKTHIRQIKIAVPVIATQSYIKYGSSPVLHVAMEPNGQREGNLQTGLGLGQLPW
jgi:hypothetical protein